MKAIKTAIAIAALVSALHTSAQNTPLSLAECRERALANSEDLKIASNNLKKAELDKEIATTAFLPSIEGTATSTYVFNDMDMMGMEMRMRGVYMAGITLTQPIFAGGKIINGRKLAKIGVDAANEQNRMTRMDILVEADNAYWTCIAVAKKVKLMEQYCAQMDTVRQQIQATVNAQLATESDLLRVDAKAQELKYQMQKARNGLLLCQMSLNRLIGAEPSETFMLTDTAISVSAPANIIADMEARPEIALLKKQVEAETHQVKMAKADLMPMVGLSAGYTHFGNIKMNTMVDDGSGNYVPHSQEISDGMSLAMLAVKVPIFHFGEKFKKVNQAKLKLQNAELTLEKNSKLMNLELQQAIQNYQDGFMMVETAQNGLAQAAENLRVMQNKYNASMLTLTDLLDAQTQWHQAESNLIEAQTQFKIYEVQYLRVTGTLE